ncbi:hypothetical protein V8E36_002677 [Tilletia maclaganii]
MLLIWHCLFGLSAMGFMSDTAADTFKLSSNISTQRGYMPIPLKRPQQDPFLHKNGTLDVHALEYHMLRHGLMLHWLFARDRDGGNSLAPSTSNFLVESSAYDPDRSQSHPSLTGSNFVVDMFASHSVTGVIVRDQVVIDGMSGVDVTFGLANQPLFSSTSQAQAICGMSMPGAGNVGNLPIFYEMMAQGAVSEPIYAMRISRRGPGAVYLGGYDAELVWGQVSWMPSTSTEGRWIFPGKVQGISTIFCLDSAARFIVMPYNLAEEVFSRLGLDTRTHLHDRLGIVLVASYLCEDPPIFELQIAGRVIRLSLEALNVGVDPVNGRCHLSAYGSPTLEHQVALGIPFFESIFVIFDVASRRLGFADPR